MISARKIDFGGTRACDAAAQPAFAANEIAITPNAKMARPGNNRFRSAHISKAG